MIAQLRGNTITEESGLAVEAHIAAIKAEPELAAQAEAVLTEIEREAAARGQPSAPCSATTRLPTVTPAVAVTPAAAGAARQPASSTAS